VFTINQSFHVLAPSPSKEWSIVMGKTTWNAPEIIKTNNFNYYKMISQKNFYRSFFKDCVEFEVQCLKGFLAMFND
jgi:hypothetical protein